VTIAYCLSNLLCPVTGINKIITFLPFSDCVHECCLILVSDKLGNSWKDLGRKLSVCESQIQNISNDGQGQKEQGFDVLYTWKNSLGSEANVRSLTDALEKISRKDVADQLVNHYKEKHVS
jgi:hypothetical protein